MVNAALRSSDPTVDSAGEIQTVTESTAWIVATKDSGWVIHTVYDLVKYERTALHSDPVATVAAHPSAAVMLVQPMDCPILPPDPGDPIDPGCPPRPPPPPPPPPTTFSGTLLYYNARFNQAVPLGNARVAIFDSRGGGFVHQVQTDQGGNFSLPCPSSSLRGFLQIAASADNTSATVLDTNQSDMPPVDIGYWPTQANGAAIDECGAYTGSYYVGKPPQGELFDNMTQTVTQSRIKFAGYARSKITVDWIRGPADSTASDYNTASDVITIHELRSSGQLGLFEAAHEYGHALQNTSITPIVVTPANASECQNHDLGTVLNYQCAYIEGCADYHAVAVWGSAVGTRFTMIEQGQFAGFPHSLNQFGLMTEGAVASTMLHWSDGTGQRSATRFPLGTQNYADNVSVGNSTIVDAMRNCRIRRIDNSNIPPDGIDYLAYCMEKNVEEIVGPPCAGVLSDTQVHPNNCAFWAHSPQISVTTSGRSSTA